MIKTKADLHEYIRRDMAFYHGLSKRERLICRITQDPLYCLTQYVRYLRMEEYYANTKEDLLGKAACLYYLRKKNKIGNKLGIKIPRNCFGPGLTIYHHGNIIVNEKARIGKNCRLHGDNCIGNNGKDDCNPQIGDDLDLGVGAKILGDVTIGDCVKVGANSVVLTSEKRSNITLVGAPARSVKKNVFTE